LGKKEDQEWRILYQIISGIGWHVVIAVVE